MYKIYQVGGHVRDEIMGVKSKDIDFVFVLNDIKGKTALEGFGEMREHLIQEEYPIFLETPNCYTIRAKFPKTSPHVGLVADFVMARKETGYIKGTRQPIIELGTLKDDLKRRDFTCNAIAKDENGKYIDPFKGISAIKNRELICPISAEDSFSDDPLRILRAIRFHITKDFKMNLDIYESISTYDYNNFTKIVSEDRIREEIFKCFKHDSVYTMRVLHHYQELQNTIFKKTNLWLKPTNEL